MPRRRVRASSTQSGGDVVPPMLVHGADHMYAATYRFTAKALRQRLKDLSHAEPLQFRHQNGCDYDDHLVLRPELVPHATGLSVHYLRCSTTLT